jgi:DnaK suppressor protein
MKLKKKKLEEIKQKLLLERSRILKQSLRPHEENLGVDQEDLSDEMDHATSEVNQAMTFRLKDRERFLLAKIDKALARIERGEYGTCITCGCEIDVKRLDARPVTDLCINCKEEGERQERAYA